MKPATVPLETERLHLSKSGELNVEFVEGEVLERFDALAREALEETRKQLMMALRFLNTALWHLPPERALLPYPLATNGRVLRYDPERVVRRYQAGDGELVRDCLHTVLHCVFHHPFEKRHAEYAAWSLASDVTVELCAIDLCGERFPSEHDDERIAAGMRLAGVARSLTAPALYQVFRCGAPGEALYLDQGLTDRDLHELAALFRRDSHDLWATHPRIDGLTPDSRTAAQSVPDLQGQPKTSAGAQERGEQDRQNSEGGQNGRTRTADTSEASKHARKNGQDENDREQDAHDEHSDEADRAADDDAQAAFDEAAAEWERISKRVEAEMRAQRHSLNGEGGMLQNLTVANRKPADYDVAFVFVDEESMNVKVPAWAMKVTMTQEEVMDARGNAG